MSCCILVHTVIMAKEQRERHADSIRAKQQERSARPEVKAAKKARMKQYRIDTKEHIKAYYENNREHILTRSAEHRARPDVKARMAAYSRQWAQDNPISRYITTALGNDRGRGWVGNVDKSWAVEQLELQDCKCVYCAIELQVTASSFSLDQASIERIDNSQPHIKTNCIFTCVFCNRARNQADQALYIQFADALQTGHVPAELLENTHASLEASQLRANNYDREVKQGGKWSDFIKTKELNAMWDRQGGLCGLTVYQCSGAQVPSISR